jgi:ATP-dependent Clp protease ATP-binding subunit ClpC
MLDRFGTNLTEKAKQNELDPIIGREREIERIIQILSRRKKNNPVLIGEPGVGKTAIVEGLAEKIAQSDVPESLLDKSLLILDIPGIVAGTKYRGQFEERMKAIMKEIKTSDDVIVFIDEIHTLVGAGGAEGALDASNILKPALARGEMQCIGASTLDEYRKYIEKDGALERRFQIIMVDPPTPEETLEILKGLKKPYEEHHHVHYSLHSLQTAVKLASRYISDRYLPDKAIDVIDETGSRVHLSMLSKPPEIDGLEEELEIIRIKKNQAVEAQEYEEAAAYRDEEKNIQLEIDMLKKRWRNSSEDMFAEVSEENIAEVVSMMTGIPLYRLEQSESQRLLNMETEIRKRIIGQQEALDTLAKAIRRSRAGLKDPQKPIGSFIFLGPTGVGKTEMARALAEFLFNDPDALIRLDMSEYMEKFNVSRLIGAPPGYVGYNEGGQLTEKVRRKPYSVILLDEIEKAHPDIFNILLQVLDTGVLTDGVGRKVNFRNTILIMTSNLGARKIGKEAALGFRDFKEFNAETNYKEMKVNVTEEVKKTFNPEFLNRIDEVIVFHSLTRDHILKIIDILMVDLEARLAEKNLKLVLREDAKDFLVGKGFDPKFGARPLKRAIQKWIEDPLADELLKEIFVEGDRIEAISEDSTIIFRHAEGDFEEDTDIKTQKEKEEIAMSN